MKKLKIGSFKPITDRFKLNFVGVASGLLMYGLSFTPSLLPRGYVVQGVAAGLSFATGYGLGVLFAHFYHKLPKKHLWAMPKPGKQIVLGVLAAIGIAFMIAGSHWQDQIRVLTQAAPKPGTYYVWIVLIAVLVSALLIWLSRGIRHFGQYLGQKLNKFLPRKVAIYGGGLLAAVIIVLLINGVLVKSVMGAINYTFGLANGGTPAGIHQPQNSIYSGSPTSYIDWNTLGEKGREFVASAPSATEINKFTGPESQLPSRLYVGLESAPSIQERVNLIIKELDRTGASKRQAVLIAIPTGSGGIDAKSVQSVEYLYGGDTTTLGIQYSYLPSWLSFLTDQNKARETGKAITDGVYSWWSHLDPSNRPKLLMYGESLGSFGADGAFTGAADMHALMSGVLLAGPPNVNHLWSGIVANREPGTPEVLPIYQNGEVVRFTNGEGQVFSQPATKTWAESGRVGFIQHASDPVIWWNLSLMWSKPDWLREPRGSDVLSNMRWYPFVTEWQVALDLPFAFGVTAGHGHNYGNSMSQCWTAVLNIQLSPEKTKQLNDIIVNVKG